MRAHAGACKHRQAACGSMVPMWNSEAYGPGDVVSLMRRQAGLHRAIVALMPRCRGLWWGGMGRADRTTENNPHGAAT